ncbi:hypothetical protein BCR36DRAFT_412079 [Piromyces finnis]|uniref:G-protein coupled receptors family 3 profile domain-containing protein n=1 Tax=Piromyces finnis TaxID=1754191 RepID=A0A1Y1VAI2_9FUNG|nr:hypothetical protein BCR36DRAFT_412079 [Piromyces finnis]|eukprot:ORX51098.1 hypothetical protein BCR36DRAFT_412079 [Piromyces finnis]
MLFNYTTFTTLVLLFYSLVNVYAQNIAIFLKQPDMQNAFDVLSWEQKYEDLINEYLTTHNVNNPELKNVKVELYFYEYLPINIDHTSEYLEFIKEAITHWGNSTIDMMILDDRYLFNDVALIECDSIELYYKSRTPTRDHLLDMTPFIKDKSVLEYHDARLLNDGKLDDKIYGLPFELDFDYLYYHTTNEKAKAIVDMMNKLTWDELLLLSRFQSKEPFYIALGDEDDVLNLFLEYTNNKYNLSKDLDESFYNVFYNGTAKYLLNSFKDFINTYTDNNYNKTLRVSLDDVYTSFMKKETLFFRGKASHHNHFNALNKNYNTSIAFTLPPKYTSTLTEKFLVINKHSKIDPKILTEVALQLTSKEIQYLRAKTFGSIPTYDFNVENDKIFTSYCKDFENNCQNLKYLNKIYVKDIFQSRYSPPLFETRLLLPSVIKKFITGNYTLDETISVFKNVKELSTTGIDFYINIIYIVTTIGILYSLSVIYYIHRFNKHPYIKVISPIFCVMIIFGYIMSMIEPLMLLPPYFILKCKILSVYEIISASFIIVPMLAVTFRIYYIIKSDTVSMMDLNNKRLFIIIISVILVTLIYKVIMFISDEFYYMSFGYIVQSRLPYCFNANNKIINRIDDIYLFISFIALVAIAIQTGRVSTKFGSINYIYAIIIFNVANFVFVKVFIYLSTKGYTFHFLIISILFVLLCCICIHILVGTRINYIKHNNKLGIAIDTSKYSNNSDLIGYVAIRKNNTFNFFDWLKNLLPYTKGTTMDTTMMTTTTTSNELNDDLFIDNTTSNNYRRYKSQSFSTFNSKNYLKLFNSSSPTNENATSYYSKDLPIQNKFLFK